MTEVELPDPHELEEAKGKAFTRRVALTTAIYAVVLSIAALGGNNATKEMLLAQQQASDLWAFYQAKAIREHQYRIQKLRLDAELGDRASRMAGPARQRLQTLLARFAEEEQRYSAEKREIEQEARRLERERDINRERDPYFDFGEALLQIAIVISSIAILSSSRPIYLFSLLLAGVGVVLTVNGYMLLFKLPFLRVRH